jgi:hypothetical protein
MNRQSVTFGPCPMGDTNPMTVDGTRAMVERYYAMKRGGLASSTPEVGVGGAGVGEGSTTHPSSGPKKTKSIFEVVS